MASEFHMKATKKALFEETYRVVAVEDQSLTIQGVDTGEVLTIVTAHSERPLTAAEYPPGKLITLSDPLQRPVN
jgi:hypothetical protein